MRMRRKKHREERMENCSELMITDILQYKNNIRGVFCDYKPLYIEIGCGKGKFILENATLNPDINYIAVEKNFDVLVLAMEKVQAAGLTNVKFLAGDANVFAEFDTETRCDRIFINFCDPWKKSGQKKRRLTHERFLDIYKKLLNPGGEVHFKTDNMKLFEFSLNSFADYGLRMKNITLDLHNSGFEGNIMTEYETLFSEQGMPIYRCEVVF
ncbi:MAG: tRNA (guanosine(46)-N7)-methyltransferase TrmB [Clostridia bacterium]|nr:tRNA (guanosine(46)-N7)-methyltransferase TrmB [Clostridia bacterium]